MPVDYRAPNINARSLGQHLRKIREILELSYPEAASLLGRDANWLARVETGFGEVTPDQVGEILDAYGAPPRVRDVLVDLASRPAGPPWLARHVGRLKALVRDIYTVESESPIIHTFGIARMPELVRCEEYARLLFQHHVPRLDVEEELDLLRNRQRHAPSGRPRTLDVILDGYMLEHHGGPADVMRAQFTHLLDLAADGRSTVRVIPTANGVHAGLNGSFDVLEFPGVTDRISLVHTALGIDAAQADLWDTWKLLEDVTLSPADSRALLEAHRAAL
ncbi:helix-turn-helix domain-containing protein [Actinomadura decatromicini]|uniref:Helix-turn-helix domain-containing protein n=1 Tax=Actinomadura decatromicini TaxID=2604572 RepID=A0A5D3FLN1_9ACTN|nr:helix-turn-helix transcriptional regulator [Actinomadura decatromicini]TYK49133.1 helix-turn-helix domain-containing protein [Actinomadura decatromicini]